MEAGDLQCLAESRRQGAEVLTYNDRGMALRFQRQQTQQIAERVRQIRTVGGVSAVRDQPKPRQPHGMIDAHATGVAQRRAQRRQEWREPTGGQGAGREAGQLPVLTERIEQIGRCPDSEATEDIALSAPRVTAARVHTDGEIADRADTHTRGASATLRNPQRPIGKPLQETVIQHLPLVRRGEHRNRRTARLAQVHRPAPPIAHPGRVLHRLQCLEYGVLRQQFAAIGAETRKVQAQRPIAVDERLEQRPQQAMLGARGGRPVDERLRLEPIERLAQAFGAQRVRHKRLAEHQRRGCVQRIEEQARRW